MVESGVDRQKGDAETVGSTGTTSARRPRVKQDFDYIQKSDFADKAFDVIQEYFKHACTELNGVSDMYCGRFIGQFKRSVKERHSPQAQRE